MFLFFFPLAGFPYLTGSLCFNFIAGQFTIYRYRCPLTLPGLKGYFKVFYFIFVPMSRDVIWVDSEDTLQVETHVYLDEHWMSGVRHSSLLPAS